MRFKKPQIGITLSETREEPYYRWPARKAFDYLKQEYYNAILQAGGIPVLLPNVDPPDSLGSIIETLDGLLLTGGGDMNPAYYAQAPHPKAGESTQARDKFELALVEWMLEFRKPILGICRGHQILNVAMGGTLFQDLSCIPRQTLVHADPEQTAKIYHKVTIEPDSLLFRIVGSSEIETNSSHHQAVDEIGRGLRTVAYAPDGVIEALEHPEFDYVLSVQWHPEVIIDRDHSQKLFASLVEYASKIM